MNLIITPVYRAYGMVTKMCQAIDENTVNPYLHILIDDDSGNGEVFPVKPSQNRRIIMIKRDISGVIHKNGAGQAMQLGYDWANQIFINEHPNNLPYENVFLIESDVIVQKDWDKKMLDVVLTLPTDWLTLDVQSIDLEGNLVFPTTNKGNLLTKEGDDLEITYAPDFQVTLFNPKIFDSGISFSSFNTPIDTTFGKTTARLLGGYHYRTKLVSAYHFISKSTRYLSIFDSPYRSPFAVIDIIKDVIKDKVVCDLGCRSGDLMVEMEKYAKEVKGIEINGLDISQANKRGLNIIRGDVTIDPIPEADVYYLWIQESLVESILKRIKKGIVILGADPAIAEDLEIDKLELKGEWREVEYNEGDGERQSGIFKVFITERV